MWGVQERDGRCEVGIDQGPSLWKEGGGGGGGE
jgi:hypothetical protein